MKIQILKVLALVQTCFILGLISCKGDLTPRRYVEIEPKSAVDIPMMPSDGIGAVALPFNFSFTLPEGWSKKDTITPMRTMTLTAPDPSLADMGERDPYPVDVSIAVLSGPAGGLEANIKRWLTQLGMVGMDPASVLTHTDTLRTKDGDAAIVVDLTEKLSGDLAETRSTFGIILPGTKETIFIKAMGERDRVIHIRKQMRSFAISLRRQPDTTKNP